MRVYFDNTASTHLYSEVIDVMAETLKTVFGNPSSVHFDGRKSRVLIENARKSIAGYLNCAPSEIFFTSGGTEANNMALYGAVFGLGVKSIITSPIEHHAIIHTLDYLKEIAGINIHYLNIDKKGHIDINQLEDLLKNYPSSLVSLMHANNEISNLLPIKEISNLTHQYDSFFHSDMVQTICHYKIDLQRIDVDIASSSGHKFHAPKGIGFIYINNKRIKLPAFIHGGGQERNMRGGTENIAGIAGLEKAFEIGHKNIDSDMEYISDLKKYMIEKLNSNFKGINYIGDSADKGLYTVLSVAFPENMFDDMLLMNLDIEGISASSGSACTSGSLKSSHVIKALNVAENKQVIRFSYSKFNNKSEVDFCIEKLKKLKLSD